jgi:E1A/CREB-binding protein
LRKPLPQSSVLGAKDLPITILSDHIEDRLFKRLKQERQDRAAAAGKSYDEVSYIMSFFMGWRQ